MLNRSMYLSIWILNGARLFVIAGGGDADDDQGMKRWNEKYVYPKPYNIFRIVPYKFLIACVESYLLKEFSKCAIRIL